MKVLLCSPYKGLTPNNKGGIAIWANNIINYYNSINTDIAIDIFEMDRMHDSGSILHRFSHGVPEYISHIKSYKDYIKKNQHEIDIIHLCTSASLSLIKDILMINIAHKLKIPICVHFHFGRIPQIFNFRNWEYKLINEVIRKADLSFVMDKASFHTLKDAGYLNKIMYLPNPLSDNVNKLMDKDLVNYERSDNTILFVGHVIPTKGVYELVEACSYIKNIKLILLGHVNEEIKDKLQQYDPSGNWLQIRGDVSYEKVIEEMNKCTIFTLPSYTEGFPNVILESMACGCPIVASKVGAIPEMLESENDKKFGLLIDSQDCMQLQNALEQMLYDKEFRNNCGKNARARVNERYGIRNVWEIITDGWKQVCITQVLNN